MGFFNGNGHTVRNLNITNVVAGFFHTLGSATVKNLFFDSSCSFNGVYAGALAARAVNTSSLYVYHVKSAATVNGQGPTGGLIGALETAKQCINYCFHL